MSKEIILPEGFKIDKIEGNKIILKEDKLPANIIECWSEVLDNTIPRLTCTVSDQIDTDTRDKLALLSELLFARDVYRMRENTVKLKIWKVTVLTNINGEYYLNATTASTPELALFSFARKETTMAFIHNFKETLLTIKEFL